MAGQARWRKKPSGVATVRRGKWWVPKDSTPAGGTAAATTRTQAQNRLVPREFAGDPTVFGNWKYEPRLNPDQYEWTQNEFGRFFARPRNELTGLPSYARADVKGFDAQTGAQQQRITDAYNAYATQAAQDAAAGAANLGSLASLSGQGFTDTISGSASGPYGQVAPTSLSQAERALPGVLSQSARQGSAAQSAQTIAGLNQLPTLARAQGLTAGEQYTTQRQGQRSDLIQGYRKQQSDAEAAAAETDFKNQQLQATLAIAQGEQANTRRGQTLSAQTADKDRSAALYKEAARLRQEAQLARENNKLQRWKTLMSQADAKQKAGDKAKVSNSDLRQMTKRAREMWDGVPRTVTEDYTDANGNAKTRNRTEYVQYNFTEIVRELMAMGAPRSRATAIARQVTGNATGTLPSSAAGTAPTWRPGLAW